MKKLYVNILLVTCLFIGNSNSLYAQSYTYSMQTDTYIELTNTTLITNTITGTAHLTSINNMQFNLFGENFNFNGTSGLAIGENSFLSATNTTGTKAFSLDAFHTGLQNHNTLSTEIAYTVDPSTNGPILKVQYKNMGLSLGSSSDYVNFQIWIYQSTGDIEYRYGSNSVSSGTFGSQGGPSIGIFLASNDFSQVFENQFLVSNASNPTVDYVTPFATITGVPTNGTVYRFASNSTIGTTENQLITTSLFPNPATTDITVVANSQVNRVVIVDMLGKTITDKNLKTNKTINIESLNKGLYLARIYTDSGISTARFIKQ